MCIVDCMNMCSFEAGSEGRDKELKRCEGLIQVGQGNYARDLRNDIV